MAKRLDGNELLYHFFQKSWLEEEPDAAQDFIKKAIDTLGIWMDRRYYQELPVVVPYAVRDSSCRHSGPNQSDEWGAPDANGFFRDDNSLIKGIVSSMRVISPTQWLKGFKGNGFTASHVWREPTGYSTSRVLASRRPDLNSFVPNLVWLPKQIAKLTDREGSFAQRYLQMLSRHIYEPVSVNPRLQNLISNTWDALPVPVGLSNIELPDVSDITFFEYKDKIVEERKKKIQVVSSACNEVLANGTLSAVKVISTRYTQGLPNVNSNNLKKFVAWLEGYLQAIK